MQAECRSSAFWWCVQLQPAAEGRTKATLATAGGVGNLPASQAYHNQRSEVANDRRRITGARRSGRTERRTSALWSREALLCVALL